jgi:tripartite motif-containing protein 71
MKLKLFFKGELYLFSRLIEVHKIRSSTLSSVTVIICVVNIIEVSYNQPRLPLCACWNPDGITFANEAVVAGFPYGLFVNRNNTVYMADGFSDRIHVWRDGSTTVTKTIFNTLRYPISLFVNIDGEIYVGGEWVEKWPLNAAKRIVVLDAIVSCDGLFVDTANYLYCSIRDEHRVVKQSLGVGTNMLSTVAGNGSSGSASHMLNGPWGIFVDINFDLYVADCLNHRVQLFEFGQVNGITIAGEGATLSINLKCPTAVFLDNDGNVFIADYGNHRILGSTSNGFYCVVGCSGVRGAAPYQLNNPTAAAFDSYGNIFVADTLNSRIKKFILMTNTFGK